MEINKNKVTVHYKAESLAGGLRTNNNAAPLFFTVAGEDRIFYPAEATIMGNGIVLFSKKVKKPVAVRYAFTNYPVTNLENTAGIPAVPFRTDNWPEPEVKK